MLAGILLSELIAAIYDCALDVRRWPESLGAINRALGFKTGAVSLLDVRTQTVPINVSVGVPPEWVERLAAMEAELFAMWGGSDRMRRLPLEEPLVLSREIDPAVVQASRLYREWARPQRIHDQVAMVLRRDADALSTVGFGRGEEEGPVGSAEVEGVRLLAPHLRRAVTISGVLDARSLTAATLGAVLDGLVVPVLLLDAGRRPVHLNAAAETMLRRGLPLRLRGGRIEASTLAGTRALEAAMVRGNHEATLGRMGLEVPVAGPSGDAFVLHLLPLSAGDLRTTLLPRAAAAVFVAAAASPRGTPVAAVAALFDLTAAEARVLDLMAAGHSGPKIAERLGLRPSTVKTHTLRILEKTGAAGQAELRVMLANLASPVAP